MRLRTLVISLAVLIAPAFLHAEPVPAAVVGDPPIDATHPAVLLAEAIPSHGDNLNAVFFAAAGAGRHPTVLLLHGLPGIEQNLDLAQAMRRDGWNVLTLHYRGSWGGPGTYTSAHCIEDAAAALAWLRDPSTAAAAGIDPGRIVVIGHSFGGFVAAYTGGHDVNVMATGLISAVDLGPTVGALPHAIAVKVVDDNIGASAGLHMLAGTSPEALAEEAARNAAAWDFVVYAPALARHPLLIVTSNDGLAAGADKLARAAAKLGGPVSQIHLATDHSYSDQRIALDAAVLRWLESLPGAPKAM